MAHHDRAAKFASLLATLAFPFGAVAQTTPLGSEFQVNTYTTNNQSYPSVAAEADGDFIVVWASNFQDASGWGVFVRRFSSAGTPLVSEFQVNVQTLNNQQYPAVALDADGDFVVVWQSDGQDGDDTAVFARGFSSAGAPVAGEFLVNTYISGSQRRPAIAMEPDGDLVIAWQSAAQDGSNYGIFARGFSSAGVSLAMEFQVNTYTLDHQTDPSIAVSASGDFIVAWQDIGQDGSDTGVFARRFSSAGTPLATEIQINTYTTSLQTTPSVALAPSGEFVVAWQSLGQDGSSFGVFARNFSSTGAPQASEFQVNTYTTNYQSTPSVGQSDGRFVIAWHSNGQDGASFGVFGRRLSSAGGALAGEFQVNTYTTGQQNLPAVAAGEDGDFVVAWHSISQDGSGVGVFSQRLTVALAILDIDGDGSTEPLSDGLLVLRFLFDFAGNTLTSGVVNMQTCTRCDAASIEAYLTLILALLDIDDDGSAEPLTDGLLVLRFLFGFTGTTLTSGAVDTQNCMRCDATEIEPYLQTLI